MDDIITTGEAGNPTAQEGAKNFSQDEVNRIVSERLMKERVKIEADLAKRETDLTKREYTYAARGVLEKLYYGHDKENPTAILDVLNVTDVAGLERALAIIDKAAGRKKVGAPVWTPPGGKEPSANSQLRDAFGLSKQATTGKPDGPVW